MFVSFRRVQTLAALQILACVVLPASCRPTAAPDRTGVQPDVYRDEVRFGLTFEERMAIAPALTRLKSEATRRADELYDPFRSREDAIRNEEAVLRLFTESREQFLSQHRLTEDQLDEIIREYQASLGANLR